MDAYVVSYIFILMIQQNYGIFILSIVLAAISDKIPTR